MSKTDRKQLKTKITALLSGILLFSAFPVGAQAPAEKVDLTEITFVRQNFVRNYYDTSILTSSISMDGPDLFLPNSANLVVGGEDPSELKQENGKLVFCQDGQTIVRVGAFHPFYSYEADFDAVPPTGSVGICFFANDWKSRLVISRKAGEISAVLDGSELKTCSCEAGERSSLRVQYTGQRFHVFATGGEDSQPQLLMSIPCDKSSSDMPVKWSWGVYAEGCAGARLSRAQSFLSCGTGQADPQVIQNSDGTPFIRDGRLYLCMTTRGFELIPDSYQGVYSLGLTGYDLRLEGALFFCENDGILHGYHATKVVRHENEWLLLTTTHGGTKHTLAWAKTDADILHGIHYLECSELDFPHNDKASSGFNAEDPDFFYDAKAKRWRLAYCALKDKSYVTYLCESRKWNGGYRQIAESEQNNNTGIRITTVGGKRYVLSGGTGTTFYIYEYPSLKYAGTFRQEFPNGGFRGWPTIVPVRCGNYERYLWITFDRGAQTGRYSYGTLYFYLSDRMWKAY